MTITTTFPYGFLGTDCYLVTDEKKRYGVIIDPAAPPSAVLKTQPRNLSICYLLLTHCHFDHLVYYEEWLNETGAAACISKQDAKGLSDANINLYHTFYGNPRSYPKAEKEISDGEQLRFGEETVKVILTPGHTAGSACFLIGSALYSGDTVFCDGGVGRVDFPTGNAEALSDSVQKLMNFPEYTLIYPGHGAATTVGRERTFHTR